VTVNWLVSTSVFVDADSKDLLMRTGWKWWLQLVIYLILYGWAQGGSSYIFHRQLS